MQEETTQFRRLKIVGMIFLIASLVANGLVLILERQNLFVLLGACVSMLALLAALLYIYKNAAKFAARYMLWFKLLYCLSCAVITVSAWLVHPVPGIFCAFCLAVALVVALWKNLGSKLSMILCCLLAFMKILIVLLSFLAVKGFSVGQGDGLSSILRAFAELTLTVILFAVTTMKYADKKRRGRAI